MMQDGEQIGGFYEWATDLLLDCIKGPDGQDYRMQRLKLIANEVWLLKHPAHQEMVVRLYQYMRNRLVLVMQRDCTVIIPNLPLNTKYMWPLEVVWTS